MAKALFVLDRPEYPRNIDLFRLWEGNREFKEMDLYELDGLLNDNLLAGPRHLATNTDDLYMVMLTIIPVQRNPQNGTLKVLGRCVIDWIPDEEDVPDRFAPMHTIAENLLMKTLDTTNLRFSGMKCMENEYVPAFSLRQKVDLVVNGIGTYALLEDHRKPVARTKFLKITATMLMRDGLLEEWAEQRGGQVFETDNNGKLLDGSGLLSEAGIGNQAFFRHIEAKGFDSTVICQPGLE